MGPCHCCCSHTASVRGSSSWLLKWPGGSLFSAAAMSGRDGSNWGGGCPSLPPPPPPPVVTRRHDMRHKKTRSQIEPHRVPGGRQHTPSLEAFNANHCIFQETVFCLFLLVHQGSYSLSLSLSVPSTHSCTHSTHSQSNCCGATGCMARFFSAWRG